MKESPLHLWLLLAAGVANGIGQVVMRWGGKMADVPFAWNNLAAWTHSSRWWLFGLLITWLTGICWAVLLRDVRLSVALMIFAGGAYSTSYICAFALLGERLSTIQIAGLTLVILGLAMAIAGTNSA